MAKIDDGPWEAAGATFSPDRRYRYRLWRAWDETRPRVVFVMLNPSVADELRLDPTLRRCVGFARAWGCGSVEVVNAFALVSTDPAALREDPDPVGPDNDRHLLEAVTGAEIVVAAWGVWAGGYRRRDVAVLGMLLARGVQPKCLGTTIEGDPRHPLYLAAGTPLVGFPPPEHAAYWEAMLEAVRSVP